MGIRSANKASLKRTLLRLAVGGTLPQGGWEGGSTLGCLPGLGLDVDPTKQQPAAIGFLLRRGPEVKRLKTEEMPSLHTSWLPPASPSQGLVLLRAGH